MPKRSAAIHDRKSVLILSQFYPPEPCAAANRVSALSRALQNNGFVVHVVTAVPNFPSGAIAPEDRLFFPKTVLVDGVRLTRVYTFASTRLSARNRFLNWLSVAVSMTVAILFLRRRYDLVIVTMPPITLAMPAFCAMIRHRARLIVDVRDVFPDVAIKMGYWRAGGFAARVVGAISGALYRVAALVICVTDSAATEVIARGSYKCRTIVAANGFDPLSVAKTPPYQKKPAEFVAAFVGNMGLATGLDVILDAAALLQDETRISFVLAGGGADYIRLVRRIAAERLARVIMLGVIPRDAANALIAHADVSIVTLHASITDSLPTKLFDALVLGCPVVCSAAGEARRFVELSGGGIAVTPGDGALLASALRTLLLDADLRAILAERGRAYVIQNYDRTTIMASVATRLAYLM